MADDVVLARWYQRFDHFSFSSKAFYEMVEEQLRERQVPEVYLSRVFHPEGGIMSAHREYLRIGRGTLTFMVCAAPFGVDFFVSSWLLENPGCLSGCLTTLIPPLAFFARKIRYYEEDTADIFRDSVHECVMASVDGMLRGIQRVFTGNREPSIRKRLL